MLTAALHDGLLAIGRFLYLYLFLAFSPTVPFGRAQRRAGGLVGGLVGWRLGCVGELNGRVAGNAACLLAGLIDWFDGVEGLGRGVGAPDWGVSGRGFNPCHARGE